MKAWLRTHTALMLVFLHAPIAVLVLYSFNKSNYRIELGGFTLDWYRYVLNSREFLTAMWNTVSVALVVTAVSTLVGTMTALGLARMGERGGGGTRTLLYLPIAIPEVVMGAALSIFFVMGKWELGFWTVVIAHVSFTSCYVAIVVKARLAGFDPELEAAARDLGAGPWGVFWRVKFPLMLPGVVAAALLVFTLSVDDYIVTSFVDGPFKLVPVYIYDRIKVSIKPEVNAVSTLLLAVTIALVVIAQRLLGGRKKEGDES